MDQALGHRNHLSHNPGILESFPWLPEKSKTIKPDYTNLNKDETVR